MPAALREGHPSALRIFDELLLDVLSRDEASRVIDRALAESNQENSEQTAPDDAGRTGLINLPGGYPHFIQQFGYSAFAADTDPVIGEDQVSRSGLDRCLRRRGVEHLAHMRPTSPIAARTKRFKATVPGYRHLDHNHLLQMPGASRRWYLFVAIDRATCWLNLERKADKSARTAEAFLRQVRECPFPDPVGAHRQRLRFHRPVAR